MTPIPHLITNRKHSAAGDLLSTKKLIFSSSNGISHGHEKDSATDGNARLYRGGGVPLFDDEK